MFGPKGENEKGSCRYSHPRSVKRCIYDHTIGCKKPDCKFFHAEASMTSHSAARPVKKGFNKSHNMAFLDQREVFQLLDKYFQQKMNQDTNNDAKGRGFYQGKN